jgi:nicotinic acid mononucleotide adenylyltransferase
MSRPVLLRMRRIQALLDQLNPADDPRALLVPGSPQPRGDVIVMPGTFNPPTSAHVALLRETYNYIRQHRSIHLYAAFTMHTVNKEQLERPLLLDRVLLLQNVLRRLPHTGILLINQGLYVEQAQGIRQSFPAVRHLFFLMGYDKILQVLDHRYYKDRDASLSQLFALTQLLVVPRGNAGEQELNALLQQPQNEPFARFIHLVPFSHQYRDVSSTRVREGHQLGGLDTPREVKAFMRKTRAYAPPIQTPDRQIDYYRQRMDALNTLMHTQR